MGAMESPEGIIRVRSEKQAMDWSLVLASQGIEIAIERLPEDGQLALLVGPTDRDRAVAAIHQYERENLHRRWQQPIRWTGLLMDWRVVFCFLPLVVLFFATDIMGFSGLKAAGLMDSQAVRHGEWWRLFTAVTLHADLAHLASNVAMGILLLGLAMGSYGPGKALLASFLAGVCGNLAGLALAGARHQSLGASGMVLGALGLLTVSSFRLWRSGQGHRRLLERALAGGVMILVLLGLNPQTDVLAHVGGFLVGTVLGTLLAFLPEKTAASTAPDRGAAWLCLALAATAWWRALA